LDQFTQEGYVLWNIKKVQKPRTEPQQIDRRFPNRDATTLGLTLKGMELLLAENVTDYCHIEFEQQRQQGHFLACCDDLAHDWHINRAQEECRFVA